MNLVRTVDEMREGMNNKEFSLPNHLTAVVVSTPFTKTKADVGVQFWTEQKLADGFVMNSDGTRSDFIEIY